MTTAWSAPTTPDEVAKRAAGRRQYNAERRIARDLRRAEVMELVAIYGLNRGVQAAIARELNVNPSTVTRDLAAIRELGGKRCDACGSFQLPEFVSVPDEELAE